MALAIELLHEANDLVQDKPWAKRASVTPRRTYSAESKVIYKRKLHRWNLADLERVERSMGVEVYDAPTDTAKGQSIWLRLMAFIKNITLKMLSRILGGAMPDWALEPLYDLIRDTGAALIDHSGLTGETRAAVVKALEDFANSFLNAFLKERENNGS